MFSHSRPSSHVYVRSRLFFPLETCHAREFPIREVQHYLNNCSLSSARTSGREKPCYWLFARYRVRVCFINKISFLICYSSPANSPDFPNTVPNSIFPASIRFVAEPFVRRLIYSAYLAIKETIALVYRGGTIHFTTSPTGTTNRSFFRRCGRGQMNPVPPFPALPTLFFPLPP